MRPSVIPNRCSIDPAARGVANPTAAGKAAAAIDIVRIEVQALRSAELYLITVTTGTYVEVIEAVQRDALDSMGSLFAHVGDGTTSQLSSKTSPLSSKLSSNGSE